MLSSIILFENQKTNLGLPKNTTEDKVTITGKEKKEKNEQSGRSSTN